MWGGGGGGRCVCLWGAARGWGGWRGRGGELLTPLRLRSAEPRRAASQGEYACVWETMPRACLGQSRQGSDGRAGVSRVADPFFAWGCRIVAAKARELYD